jgi:hypothetical protein
MVVLVIVAMLLTLMAPAVQHVRESARDMDCSNRLRQIGIAIHAHEQAHKILPTNGWGYEWIGNPNRGFRRTQPGGWVYNILPYMEQASVHDLGRGMVAGSSPQKKAALHMVQTVIPGDLPPLNVATFRERISGGANQGRARDATREEVHCGADHREAPRG